ncbi:MAG: hypothetical protein K6357_01035 [Elusimicrobiota bacterium]
MKITIKKTFFYSFFITLFLFSVVLYSLDLGLEEREFLSLVDMYGKSFSNVWDDFSISNPPLVVNLSGNRLIIISDICPKDSIPIKKGKPDYCLGKAKPQETLFDFMDYKLDGKDAFLCKARETPFMTFRFCIHEKFHKFQNKFLKSKFNTDKMKVPEFRIEDALESSYLYKALMLGGKDSEKYMRFFVAARKLKLKNANIENINYENYKELIEGTARYAELKSVSSNSEIETSYAIRYLCRVLSLNYPVSDNINKISDSIFYEKGAAMCFLMDRLNIEWKKNVILGESIFSILEKNIKVSREDFNKVKEDVKRIRDLIKPFQKEKLNNKQRIIDEVKNYRGVKVIIKGLYPERYSREGGQEVDTEFGTIISRFLRYEMLGNKVEIKAFNTTVIHGEEFEITILCNEDINDIKIFDLKGNVNIKSFSKEHTLSYLRIESPSVYISVRRKKTTLTVSGNNIIIDVKYKK